MQTGQMMALMDIYGDGVVLYPDCNGGYSNLHIWQNDIKLYTHILCFDIVLSWETWWKVIGTLCTVFLTSCKSIIISKLKSKRNENKAQAYCYSQSIP